MTASEMGKKGGKRSAESRFEGKTKEEISEIMRKVRYSKQEREEIKKMGKELVNGINENV